MKTVILDAGTLGDDLPLDMFDEFGETVIYPSTPPDKVTERIRGAGIVIVNKIKLGEMNLSGAPSVKLICETATGFDNIDTEYCRERGIAVCNVRGYSSNSVAQVTIALALSLYTHITEYTRYVADGSYTKSGVQNCLVPVFHELAGRVWGVAGFGGIGQSVARAASALGCRVTAFNKSGRADGYEYADIDTLCCESDIISVHLPLNEDTRGIISRERIASMKRGAVLINAARGAVIDEAAAAEAVENGLLGGFGADVYSAEPLPSDHPYMRIAHMDNVLLTPHMAWGAYESRLRCMEEIAENIRAFLRGDKRNRV